MLISLDIALKNTGWSVFDSGALLKCGVIITEKSSDPKVKVADDNMRRVMQLGKDLKTIVNEFNIKAIIGELPHGGGKSARAVTQMALASGSIGGLVAWSEIPSKFCDPSSGKIKLVGSRSASKDEMIEAVRTIYSSFGGFPKQKGLMEHIADSIAVYHVLETTDIVKMFG